jgi:hypothetical protein
MELFSQGKTSSWTHIFNKIEYETTRNGSKLGIRWKITWAIDNYWYYGYNLVAQVWTEGANYGGQIKGNSPNRGSGVSYFPSENDYLWFDKGYSNNEITGCRVIINTTNGGSASYDTGADRTLTAPTGYTASIINSSVNFNIGENLTVNLADITNQAYNYKVYLDLYKENNTWENIKYLETTSKNFTLDLSSLASSLYALLPNSNSRPCRLLVETYIGTSFIGNNLANGNVNVTNSNPDTPQFLIFGATGGDVESDAITSIWAGFGPYNDKSDAILAVKDISMVAKNSATLKKIVIEWNGEVSEVVL